MRLKSLLLYSLLFSYSSLFAWSISDCNDISVGRKLIRNNTYYEVTSLGAKNYTATGVSGINFVYATNTTFYCYMPDYYMPFGVTQSTEQTCTDSYTSTSDWCAPPTCSDNEVLNTSSFPNSCDCAVGFAKNGDVCEIDTDGDGIANSLDPDIDGDGILNESDPDIDGDGIANDLDTNPSSPDVLTTDSTCKGFAQTKYFFPESPKFSYSDYIYHPYYETVDGCKSLVSSDDKVDSIFYNDDVNEACERSYCFVHDTEASCIFSSADRKPAGYLYMSDLKEDECYSKVDGTTYSTAIYDTPSSISCPGVAYCFLKPVVDLSDNTNSENNDSTMNDNLDLNSTSQDNQALLQASNTTNKHLSDIKDKVDLTNESLDKINETNTNLLASSKDINKNLNTANDTLSKSLSKQTLMNENLININKALSTSNANTKSLNSIAIKNNSQLQNIASINTDIKDNLQNGLFGDDPFSGVDLTDDGSSKFGDFQTTLSDNLSLTYDTNLFGLSALSGGGVSPVSFVMFGTTFTPLSMDMINAIPIDVVKAVLMFMAAIGGFITVFRTV